MPRAPVGRGLTAVQRGRRAVNAAVVAAGFVEVLSFPFLAAEELDKLGRAGGRPATPAQPDRQPARRDRALPADHAAARAVRGGRAQPQSRQRRPGHRRDGFGVLRRRAGSRRAPRPAVTGRPTRRRARRHGRGARRPAEAPRRGADRVLARRPAGRVRPCRPVGSRRWP